jgi:hypothetical protein
MASDQVTEQMARASFAAILKLVGSLVREDALSVPKADAVLNVMSAQVQDAALRQQITAANQYGE